jgi:tRNA (guanine10-N2)-dimethyltransferase
MVRTYAFELSGEHDTLPYSEALALLDVYSSWRRERFKLDQCLIVDAENLNAANLASRLGMTHRIIEVWAICNATTEAIGRAVEKLEIPAKSYRIRARRVKDAGLRENEVEREVGRILFKRGHRADLSNPELELRAIITGDKAIMGLEVGRADRSGFEDRRPHLKPFFYPGVMMPRMARAIVNLSGAKPGDLLLDPFAGTGGILVEACLSGVRAVGIDVQEKIVRGAKENIKGLDCTLIAGDAKRLPFKDASIDNAVMDTPYGRSALIRASSREDLLIESLRDLFRVLKPGKRMIIVADEPIEDNIKGACFVVLEVHTDRVHRSLMRHIYVCMKPDYFIK